MTACSLVCGDCGAKLTSVKDAEVRTLQRDWLETGCTFSPRDCKMIRLSTHEIVPDTQAHAETTGHSNFEESRESVKVRKCTQCNKVCKTREQEEQHTRFTSHGEFQDADVVMTDVIGDGNQRGSAGAEEAAEAGGAGSDTPNATRPRAGESTEGATEGGTQDAEGDDRISALVAMGFSRNKAARALHFSGDGTVEQAVDWISTHENDKECSDDPFVKPPKLTPEEAKARAEELIKQAKAKREKEEKEMEKLREAERIRSGKELAAIARKEEEQRLKRMVELREREKREEKEAREKIRKKLEQDRRERRARMGLPVDEPVEEKKDVEDKVKLPVKPREKGDTMRSLLVALKKNAPEGDSRIAFETLNKLVGNVTRDPSNPKFRTVKLENKAIQERVGRFADAVEFLCVCGWTRSSIDDGESNVLTLADDAVDDATLRMALENLDSALNNPFFGAL
jgi:polyhydroxyalkanoate synthesis regulator phasin